MTVTPVTEPTAQATKPKKSVPSTAFIMDFVRMCFTEDLCAVDFTQSLKSMGYLEALEAKRKNEFNAAMQRLEVDSTLLAQDRSEFQSRHPGIYEWIVTMESKGKKVEALYTQVYVGLRRWTLINEMRLEPFCKQNCISMLNILYPPTYGAIPTSQLTENTLNAQRNAYFRYIQAVEKSGKEVLINLEQASRRAGEANGWSVVRDIVDVYLLKARSLIEDCRAAKSSKDFHFVNKEKRADSGVSFTSTVSNFSSTEKTPTINVRPSPVTQPSYSTINSIPTSDTSECINTMERTSSNKFERFARRFKSRSADTRSQSPPQLEKRPSFNDKQNNLRKMKSTGGLNREFSKSGKHSRENSSDRGGLPQFVIDDTQRERLIREAQQDKANQSIKRQPSPSQYVYRPKTREPHLAIPEESSPTSCRITRLDQHLPYQDPYRLPSLTLPSLKV